MESDMSSSFTINLGDLQHILGEIKIAERHAAGEDLATIIGQDAALLPRGLRTVDGSFNHLLPGQERVGAADEIFPRMLPPEYKTVNDSYQVVLVPADAPGAPPGGVVITNNNYDPTLPGSHSVADADPRIISNLIVDQTRTNPAAIEAWFNNEKSQAAYAEAHGGNPPPADYIPTNEELGFILNISPDIGLSPGFNGWMTFFGQFFDHGLDLVTKGNAGTVYIPLQADDKLYDKGADGLVNGAPGSTVNDDGFGADGVFGTADDRPNFMALSRGTLFLDPKTGKLTEMQNTTTPFVDQNQTYTSIASHQVFLREYAMVNLTTDSVAGPVPVSTGRLIDGATGAIGNWAEVKAQAKDMLGITLGDYDVLNVPLLLTDPYGKFIPGAHGYPQVVVGVTVVDSTTGALISTASGNFTVEGVAGGLDLAHINIAQVQLPPGVTLPALPAGQQYKVSTVGTGHAFLNDIAHHAEPVLIDADHNPFTPKTQQVADDDRLDFNGDGVANAADVTSAGAALTDANHDGNIDVLDLADVNLDGTIDAKDLIADDHNPLTYDNEMLDAHFVTGDGRGNENIGLTTVHTIFHSEHNRLVEANKDTIIASGDRSIINEWLLTPLGAGDPIPTTPAGIDALNWNGERLFQAARFGTEMQYQHLVFEEFARKVQPNVNPFVFTNSADLDPAIVAEFAHVVYRFGHSMLPDTVDRLGNDLNPVHGPDDPQIGLIEAFLNPQAFSDSGATTRDQAGAIIRGMTRQTGNEIDEFVVDAVRSNLLGLPLDLPALNIARGRDAGVPTLNHARAQFYASTGDAQLKPYTSWFDFAENLKNPASIINFIAAYGLHPTITSATTLEERRNAATELVMGVDLNGDGVAADAVDFINGTGAWNAANSGLDRVDLWIGGLAEVKMEFGGMLGSTFNYVFETQLENLQNGDRMYYLSRTQGMNLLNQLEPNTFTDLVMRNTSLGDLHSTHLDGTLFDTADHILELDKLVAQEGDTFAPDGVTRVRDDPVWEDGRFHIGPKVTRTYGTTDVNGDGEIDGSVLKFLGGEHVVLGGTEGNDKLYGDKGIDTLWGDGGDDYLNAGSEADQVFGGDGDDIIEDFFGDGDFLRGNKGNDVINDSHGFGDVLFGDSGNDYITAGSDPVEVFAGEGDDFVLGGLGADGLMGNEGDDWIEGGEGFDTLSGENSDLFFNSPIIGNDVLDGDGNDTDYDGESGDDIMVQGPGIQRNNGMLGFDWSIGKGEVGGSVIDLGISQFTNQQALTLRDRNDSVEGASGWKYNDTILGTNAPLGAVGVNAGIVGGPATDSMLLSQNVALIRGLEPFLKLTPGALRGQTVGSDATPFASLAKDTFVFNPQTGGDILLGGAGSDSIFGKAGNDIIDGDRWLNVRIEVHANKDGTGALVTNLASVGTDGSVDSLTEITGDLLTGKINPGQLKIVREITSAGAGGTDVDIAVYAGNRSDYTIVQNANGTTTVTDNVITPIPEIDPVTGTVNLNALLGDEGTDTLSNIEILRFTDRNPDGSATGTFTDLLIGQSPATGTPLVIDLNGGTPIEGQLLVTNIASIADANGLGTFSFQWQSAAVGTAPDGVWTDIPGATNAQFTPTQAQVGRIVRFAVSFTDGAGHPERLVSAPTLGIGDLFTGTAAADNVTLTPFDDIANGNAGNDTIRTLAGNDLLNGGIGDDTLEGGDGDDRIDGGANNDTASYAGATSAVNVSLLVSGPQDTVGAGIDTLISIERLTGSAFDDTLTGNAGGNTLTGGDGADILDGGLGSDRLVGGLGNDTYFVDVSTDVVVEAAGQGTDAVFTALNAYTLTVNVENVTFTGTGNFNGLGNGSNNIIVSGSGDDTLNGSNGNDVLEGGAGNNSYTGGVGTDTVRYNNATGGVTANLTSGFASSNGFGGFDVLVTIENLIGSSFNDVFTGSGVADVLSGGGGIDNLQGMAGNDTLDGGADGDTLNGGANNDSIMGGDGDDLVVQLATDGNDFVDGGAGVDTYQLNGTAVAETFRIFTRAAYLSSVPAAVLNANTEIVITRNNVMLSQLDNVEELRVNTLDVSANDGNGVPNGGTNSGDTIIVVGDFTQTSLDYSTITVNGSTANDTVDISGLTSDHRIVFHSGGGADSVVGAIRPQDVLDFTDNGVPTGIRDGLIGSVPMPPTITLGDMSGLTLQDRMTLSHWNHFSDHHCDLQ
jgi:Ca2+-binding RTX toxin-like protein